LRNLPLERGKTPIIGMTADIRHDRDAPTSSEPDDWVDKPVDPDRLAQILDRVTPHKANGRAHILHVDDDPAVLEVVARALAATADVLSVDSLDDARQALAEHHFDLAVLDVDLGRASGLDLLPELRGEAGRAIPVIIFSADGATSADEERVHASLIKSRAALESLVTTVHERLTPRHSHAPQETA
jgi:CheY-like chemotaxis protein